MTGYCSSSPDCSATVLEAQLGKGINTGVELFIGSKVQSLFCYETSTSEGRGGEVGGSANFRNKAHRTFDPRNNLTPVISDLDGVQIDHSTVFWLLGTTLDDA